MIDPSERAIMLTESFEIDSPYNPHLTWPGGSSGVTGGVGYDFGYETVRQIQADWSDLLDTGTIVRLQSYVGRTGAQAQRLAAQSQDILIPRAAADVVFRERNIPRYTDMTTAAFQCDGLSPDSLGALVCLVFNRGIGMTDGTSPPAPPQSRLEMRQIRDALLAGKPELVPGYIRAMKRLWEGKGLDGLIRRREAEATLFEQGLGLGVGLAPPAHDMTADDLMQAELDNLKGTQT